MWEWCWKSVQGGARCAYLRRRKQKDNPHIPTNPRWYAKIASSDRPRRAMITRWIPVLAMVAAACAFAQDFPTRTVKIVVPWPPSGNVDITARTVAPAFSEALGAQFIEETLSGAAGRMGTVGGERAGRDGLPPLRGERGPITWGPAVFKSISYDPLKDFVAIGPIQSVPIVLTAAPK